ncbi:signal peptidase I [Ureibacillus sp. MALMAid1270]|uniref:signal peptidase I n=1 Tax=Ureibacillus sp. MALMAid1270 TaxID=3411629 RepID=UPI003BA4F739
MYIINYFVNFLVGCSSNPSSDTITDNNTTKDVPIIKNLGSDMITHHHLYDDMDGGNHDYSDKTLVIDTSIDVSRISRGDVVYFDNEDGEKDISRVIALPGEKVKVTKGQIYINDKKLDSFYGTAHRVGLDKENYFEKMDNEGNQYDKKSMMEVFETDMNEITLSEDEYYLIDDDWLQGKMMVLKENDYIGKVVGYTK